MGVVYIGATWGRVGSMGVCMWGVPVGAGGGAETEAERHSQAKDNAVCVCVCVCVCVGGVGVRVGGGVFMGCVGRGDACVHAVWGWGWGCVYGGRG